MVLKSEKFKELCKIVGYGGSGKISKLIASIPYLANCEKTDECAKSVLLKFSSELKNSKLYPMIEKHIMDRLKPLKVEYQGYKGDERVIQRGLALLSIASIKHYQQTHPEKLEGIDVDEELNSLIKIANDNPVPDMDSILTLNEVLALTPGGDVGVDGIWH